ncbi:uncharacterized protein LOC142632343 [Castanea sativa]|uniref:uncharacterized protein LOC142632343 n=1 Tax=Castanea sativa TaxID=21020 RepID=UPI003F64E12D
MNKMFAHQIGRNVQVYIDDMLVKSRREDGHLDDLKGTFNTFRSYNMKLNSSKCRFRVTAGKFQGFMVSQRGEELFLYLVVSPTAISVALVKEEDRVQKPVYSTSQALQGAEERCPLMEKLAFALVIATHKLKPYFQAHTVVVLTKKPLQQAMSNPEAARRMAL